MKTIIFACVHNAGRSQMSAAFFNKHADPVKAKAISAGTHPAGHVHPEVVQAMHEVGVDLSGAKPQLLTEELARDADLLVTMGCGDECPYIQGWQEMTGRSQIQKARTSSKYGLPETTLKREPCG